MSKMKNVKRKPSEKIGKFICYLKPPLVKMSSESQKFKISLQNYCLQTLISSMDSLNSNVKNEETLT